MNALEVSLIEQTQIFKEPFTFFLEEAENANIHQTSARFVERGNPSDEHQQSMSIFFRAGAEGLSGSRT